MVILRSTRPGAMLWYSVEIFGRKSQPETGSLGLGGVTIPTGYLAGPGRLRSEDITTIDQGCGPQRV